MVKTAARTKSDAIVMHCGTNDITNMLIHLVMCLDNFTWGEGGLREESDKLYHFWAALFSRAHGNNDDSC